MAVALGRVAAHAVRSSVPVPAFVRATWDGYALRSRDVRGASARRPRALQIVGEVFAEQTFARRLGPGEAVAIATGGAVPRGADAVEIFEEVRRQGDTVLLHAPVPVGARIAPVGDDIARGRVLVRAGELLRPATLGGLAACGLEGVEVYARPRVAIVPNGNELRAPGRRLGPGEIFESNNVAVAAFVAACGCEPRALAPVPDEPEVIERALRSSLARSDLVLVTGGSSVGERDHLPRLLPRFGRPLFEGIAVRPGKPTVAVRAGRKLVVALPGHPTSCLLNLHWLLLPVLRRLARLPGPGWRARTVRFAGPPAPRVPGVTTVLPLRLRKDRARSTFRGSSSITSLEGTGAFAFLPPGRTPMRAGTPLRAFVLDPPIGLPSSG